MLKRQEKWLLAAAIVAFPLQAFAQPMWGPPMGDSSLRILSDPAYLPFAGQIVGYSVYRYHQQSGDVFDTTTGAPDYSFHTITNELVQTFQYGLTDDLAFDASIGYDPTQKRNEVFPDGSVDVLQSNGFTDPTFGVTWRALDEAHAPLNLDFSASYQPDVFNSKSSSPTEDGTIARGGQSAHFGGAVSEVMPQFTVQGFADANYFGGSSTDNLINDTVIKHDSYWNYDLGLATQTRIIDQFSINAGVSHTFNPNFNVLNITNGNASISAPGDVTTLNAGLNYHIIPNTFVVGVTYAYNMHDASQNTYLAEATADTTTRNNHENVYGVRLDYQL